MFRQSVIFLLLFTPVMVFGKTALPQRIEQLPAAERPAWAAYFERSQSKAQADLKMITAEVAAQGLDKALSAPSGGDFKLSVKLGDPWFGGEEAGSLATTILSYQTPSGGWSKHTGYSDGPRQSGMLQSSQYKPGHSPHYLGTFDNRSTTEQLSLLAGVWQATQREDCRAGLLKGLQYILAAQYPSGGWPQVYPLEGSYHDAITLNDDALTHILELLYAIEQNQPAFGMVDDQLRSEVSSAFARALRCIEAMQVRQGEQKTGWCAQHDPFTLAPTAARAMEPATLSGLESARLVKFLMTVKRPSSELKQVIDSALVWLEQVQIAGLVKTKIDGKTAYVEDANSTDLFWARFYDLKTSAPVFPGRDGKLYPTFAEMAAQNDLGYDFYTTIPGSIVKNGQQKWRKMLAKQE